MLVTATAKPIYPSRQTGKAHRDLGTQREALPPPRLPKSHLPLLSPQPGLCKSDQAGFLLRGLGEAQVSVRDTEWMWNLSVKKKRRTLPSAMAPQKSASCLSHPCPVALAAFCSSSAVLFPEGLQLLCLGCLDVQNCCEMFPPHGHFPLGKSRKSHGQIQQM